MTDIPKRALDRAWDLAMQERNEHSLNTGAHHYRDALARLIADVSETAEKAQAAFAALEGFYHRLPGHIEPTHQEAREEPSSLILPDPESDLLKEAREIAKIGGYEEDEGVVQIILVALKRKDG